MIELLNAIDSFLILIIVLMGIVALIYVAYRVLDSDWLDADADDGDWQGGAA